MNEALVLTQKNTISCEIGTPDYPKAPPEIPKEVLHEFEKYWNTLCGDKQARKKLLDESGFTHIYLGSCYNEYGAQSADPVNQEADSLVNGLLKVKGSYFTNHCLSSSSGYILIGHFLEKHKNLYYNKLPGELPEELVSKWLEYFVDFDREQKIMILESVNFKNYLRGLHKKKDIDSELDFICSQDSAANLSQILTKPAIRLIVAGMAKHHPPLENKFRDSLSLVTNKKLEYKLLN